MWRVCYHKCIQGTKSSTCLSQAQDPKDFPNCGAENEHFAEILGVSVLEFSERRASRRIRLVGNGQFVMRRRQGLRRGGGDDENRPLPSGAAVHGQRETLVVVQG